MALGCSDLYIGTSATVLLELLQDAPPVATTTITPGSSSQASAGTIGASSVSRAQSSLSDSQTVTTGTVSAPSDSQSVPSGSQATTASTGPDSGAPTSLLASTGSHPTAAENAIVSSLTTVTDVPNLSTTTLTNCAWKGEYLYYHQYTRWWPNCCSDPVCWRGLRWLAWPRRRDRSRRISLPGLRPSWSASIFSLIRRRTTN